MKLDAISKAKTFWYEDQHGNDVPFDLNQGMPDNNDKLKLTQHTRILEVRETIYGSSKEAAWPVRMLKWLIKIMPNSWKGHGPQLWGFSTTVGCNYPIVKYLVEKRNFGFNEAAVTASILCERCMNICLWECEGRDLALEESYLKSSKTYCKYCDEIDEDYARQHKMWACYRTMKLGGDVGKAYKNVSVYSSGD